MVVQETMGEKNGWHVGRDVDGEHTDISAVKCFSLAHFRPKPDSAQHERSGSKGSQNKRHDLGGRPPTPEYARAKTKLPDWKRPIGRSPILNVFSRCQMKLSRSWHSGLRI